MNTTNGQSYGLTPLNGFTPSADARRRFAGDSFPLPSVTIYVILAQWAIPDKNYI